MDNETSLAATGRVDRSVMPREYRIKSTGMGQLYYGNCERCGKPCQMTYKQQSRKVGATDNNWLSAGFGHIECLRNGNWADAPVDHEA